MIQNRSRRFNTLRIIKWAVLGVLLAVLFCFVYAAFLYYDILDIKTNGFDQIEEKVIKETELIDIDKTVRFDDEKSYYVMFGHTKNKAEKIAFVPVKNKSESITIIDKKKTISKQNIKSKWQEQCKGCKLVRISPAMIDKKPLWEVTYYDQENHYIFDYLSIYDGERFQQFQLKSMYN